MDKYKLTRDKLETFIGAKRALHRRELIRSEEFYNSVCDYVQALVDNELCGEGYGEREKERVTKELYG